MFQQHGYKELEYFKYSTPWWLVADKVGLEIVFSYIKSAQLFIKHIFLVMNKSYTCSSVNICVQWIFLYIM